MASAHYTRDKVGVDIPSINSLGSIPYQAFRDLGINLIYLRPQDNLATNAKRKEIVGQGFMCGIAYPANPQFMNGDAVAKQIHDYLNTFAPNDNGQTPVMLDFEPSDGSTAFWAAFVAAWRALRPGRVTDFTPEPFKASVLPLQLLADARFDVKVQLYYGDMSPVNAWDACKEYERRGFPPEGIFTFVDGGRKNKPLSMFYEGRKVKNLEPGTCIFSANLLREAGLC